MSTAKRPHETASGDAQKRRWNWQEVVHDGRLIGANVELTGAARLYRAASSERSERGSAPG